MTQEELKRFATEFVNSYCRLVKIDNLGFEIKEQIDGPFLVIFVWRPFDRHYDALNRNSEILQKNPFAHRAALKANPPGNARLGIPETNALQRVLSESLTVDVHSFDSEFANRYIQSVTGLENQITSKANHIVYGRRGSGKSSLLAFGRFELQKLDIPCIWLSMQAYAKREDRLVIRDILIDLVSEFNQFSADSLVALSITSKLKNLDDNITDNDLRKVAIEIRRFISEISRHHQLIAIFLDDLHVLDQVIQPITLDIIYSLARGNRVYLKISAIEHLTRLFNPSSNVGLEITHDVQLLRLDYNLTAPDKSRAHIASILDAHTKYCGIPSIDAITTKNLTDRLVWVAAGVPRDALNLFSQAMTKSLNKDHNRVTRSSLNLAASHMLTEKLRDLDSDVSENSDELKDLLDRIKYQCIDVWKTNAFLVNISNTKTYRLTRILTDLRLLHVLHEGITPKNAGDKFVVLMLDYGFYVGFRTAKSVNLVQDEPKALSYRDLRSLPKFTG